MNTSISLKIQGLIIGAVILVGFSVCAVSYQIFNKGFTGYTHNEIIRTGETVRAYFTSLQDRSTGTVLTLAGRPDVIKAAAEHDTPALQKISQDADRQLLVDFITIADTDGNVIARGHSDKSGDNVKNQQNVVLALQGKTTCSVEEGTVVRYSLRAGTPVYQNGNIIGSVTAGYDFSTDKFVDMIKKNYGADCSIFQGDTRISSTVTGTDGKRITGTKLTNQTIIKTVLSDGKIYTGRNVVAGKLYDTSYWPITNSDGRPVGIFLIAKDMAVIRRQLINQLVSSVVLTLICTAVVMIICIFFIRTIIKPVKTATAMLKDISEGSGDLTKRLTVKAKDEIGDMAVYFNTTLDKVKELVQEIEKQSGILSDIGIELSSNMDETTASIQEISTNIETITVQTDGESVSVSETGKAVDSIKNTIEKLNEYIAQQAASVTQSSAAVEEMVSNIASVTKTLEHNNENLSALQNSAGVGKQDLSNIATEIAEVSKQSAGLAEITSVIGGIAHQTNLLAMNAAIEAAHAGEAGQGFSVVADEIRKLAESSSTQTRTIAKVLTTIRQSIVKITEESDIAGKQFNEIESKILAVTGLEEEIRHAMLEQNEGSREITTAVSQLNDITSEVKNGSDEMLAESLKVSEQSGTLGEINEKVSGRINEMASGILEINKAVSAINQLAVQNRDSISILKEKIGKFKTK
ncbi:MAG: methyl-accepting chemotaxis protein [Treponema sp.]|nr:methyl-accepting chemotaxis protein [Treponema sp.]